MSDEYIAASPDKSTPRSDDADVEGHLNVASPEELYAMDPEKVAAREDDADVEGHIFMDAEKASNRDEGADDTGEGEGYSAK